MKLFPCIDNMTHFEISFLGNVAFGGNYLGEIDHMCTKFNASFSSLVVSFLYVCVSVYQSYREDL